MKTAFVTDLNSGQNITMLDNTLRNCHPERSEGPQLAHGSLFGKLGRFSTTWYNIAT